MYEITTIILIVSAVLVLYRAVVGPFVFNRIMAVNFFGTKTVVILLLIGFIYGRPDVFIDIAIVYALINFTAILAYLKYVETGRLDK
ncbi:MAG: monovalent cation/H+ antiporter complex subunit F [Firmicutes bacterium]|nr:monovalent cation/H+ antiporter complex subunit F [Bacillota bacterium]